MADKLERHQRRTPRQARSRATWEAIVEAAAQILERRGPDALTTNRVAERAGVSIGTLYQYFSDKQALLLAAARRDLAADAAALPRRQRALVQALIEMLERLGRLGGASAAAAPAQRASPAMARRNTRRSNSFEQRLDLVAEWLLGWLPAPEPALRPIPIRSRIRDQTR